MAFLKDLALKVQSMSAYYVLVSDIPGTSQGTGWLGVDGDEKHPDGRVFN